MILRELDRTIQIAKSVMERLNRGESLSSVLNQVRLLAQMEGDKIRVALVDILTYGVENVPYQGKPFTNPAYRAAMLVYMELCAIVDTSKVDLDTIVERARTGLPFEKPEKTHIVSLSTQKMEELESPPSIKPSDSKDYVDLVFQQGIYH